MKRLNLSAIETRLAELGLNQSSLAERLGLSREAVSQWFKGNKFPRPALLLTLSKILSLPFDSLVSADERVDFRVAFRTNRNRPVSDESLRKAQGMAAALALLKPHLSFESRFALPPLAGPSVDPAYLRAVVAELRGSMGFGPVTRVDESGLLAYIRKYSTLIVPVQWGKRGDNALHIAFAGDRLNCVYVNLQKPVCDFKYWLLHELAHIITPQLEGESAEAFAEAFASAFLFPSPLAASLYDCLSSRTEPGFVINRVLEAASSHGISAITVFKELNAYAVSSGQSVFDFDIYPAEQNYRKSLRLMSDVLFEEDRPSVEKYIRCSRSWSGPEFWTALAAHVRGGSGSPGFIQRILDVPLSDAKGIWDYLGAE